MKTVITTLSTEDKIKEIKQLRRNLDKELQIMKFLESSREISISITNLQQSIMWLGMELKSLGSTNPYPNSYNPENTIVEPTDDNLKF